MGFVDSISRWVGRAVSWLVPVLILELAWETASRYLFNYPTVWSYDLSYMLYGAIFMLGAADTLRKDEHVRVGLFYDKAGPRAKALVDALGYLIFFFPVMGALVYYGGEFAYKSWLILEVSGESMWQPAIYPFKTFLPVAAALILVQGLARFVGCLRTLRGGDHVD
jgi:TRAP-type mannitol/chloroaromatic compound transport system permease small subunit